MNELLEHLIHALSHKTELATTALQKATADTVAHMGHPPVPTTHVISNLHNPHPWWETLKEGVFGNLKRDISSLKSFFHPPTQTLDMSHIHGNHHYMLPPDVEKALKTHVSPPYPNGGHSNVLTSHGFKQLFRI